MKKKQYDFQKEWPKIKKQLMAFSKEASVIAKRSEKEIRKISKKSKLHIDESAAKLKREHLFYLIGKEYVKAKAPGKRSSKLKKLIADLGKVDEQLKKISVKIKGVK